MLKHADGSLDVFVSYAREDSNLVEGLLASLEGRGISFWVDTQRLDFATKWRTEIEGAIAHARLVVALVTPSSRDSPSCRLEWEHAHALGKRILPIIASQGLEDDEIPSALSHHQWLRADVASSKGEGIVEAIHKSLTTDPERLHLHTDLTARARQWLAGDRDAALLVRGRELRVAMDLVRDQGQGELRLGAETVSFVFTSQRAQTRRRAWAGILATTALVALAFVAVIALLARKDSDVQRRYALRGQLSQLQANNDATGIAEVAKTQVGLVAADPVAALYVHLAQSETLTHGSTEMLSRAEWIAVRGEAVLVGGNSQLLQVGTFDAIEPPKFEQDDDQTRDVSLSLNGEFASVFEGRRMAVRKTLGGNVRIFELPMEVTYAESSNDGSSAWLQAGDRCAAALLPTDPSLRVAKIVYAQDGCEFVRTVSATSALVRLRAGNSPGYRYMIADLRPSLSDARKVTLTPLASVEGRLRSIEANQDGTVMLWVEDRIFVFANVAQQGSRPKVELMAALSALGADSAALAKSNRRVAMVRAGAVEVFRFGLEPAELPVDVFRPPKSAVVELQDKLSNAIRSGGEEFWTQRIEFDATDDRIFVGGRTARVVSGLDGRIQAEIDAGHVNTISAAQSFYLSGKGEWLVGVNLIHGGNGTVAVDSFKVPKTHLGML